MYAVYADVALIVPPISVDLCNTNGCMLVIRLGWKSLAISHRSPTQAVFLRRSIKGSYGYGKSRCFLVVVWLLREAPAGLMRNMNGLRRSDDGSGAGDLLGTGSTYAAVACMQRLVFVV